MRRIKTLGLALVAMTALAAFTSSAAATVLTSPTGTTYTGTVTAQSHAPVTKIEGSFVTVECKQSHLEFKVESHGASKTVSGNVKTHTYSNCNFPVTVVGPGTYEIHAINSGTYRTGTLTSTGTQLTIESSIGTCIFTTSSTDMGVITPTNDTGGHMTIDTESAAIPRTGGSFLCGPSARVAGAHTITTPATGWIDA